jgi:hypothetical protein
MARYRPRAAHIRTEKSHNGRDSLRLASTYRAGCGTFERSWSTYALYGMMLTVQALLSLKSEDVMVFHTALPRANTLYQQDSLLPHLPEFLLHIGQGQMARFKDHRP